MQQIRQLNPTQHNTIPNTTKTHTRKPKNQGKKAYLNHQVYLKYQYVYIRIDVIMKITPERTWRLTKKAYDFQFEVKTPIYDAMLRVLETGTHLNLSEYVEDLIENDVKTRGIQLEPIENFNGNGTKDINTTPKIIETGIVSTRVPLIMMNMINELLEAGYYLRVSDYIRHTIKKDLESRDFKPKPIEQGEKKQTKKWRPSETTTVSTQIPMPMLEDIDKLLTSGLYLRVSDYLIDLIRKDLRTRAKLFRRQKSKKIPVT